MSNHYESFITTFGCGGKSSLISESVTEIQINKHLAREKPDNTTYARSLGPYVWQPFMKSIQGQICSSTPRIKSWFFSDHPGLPVILGYLILPLTSTLE
jgi:hypothetical protein